MIKFNRNINILVGCLIKKTDFEMVCFDKEKSGVFFTTDRAMAPNNGADIRLKNLKISGIYILLQTSRR